MRWTEWTPHEDAMLSKLLSEWKSASQIAAEMSRPYRKISRNAVIGRIHRLGLAKPAKPASPQPRQETLGRVPPRKPAAPARNADAFHGQQRGPKAKMGRQLPMREEELATPVAMPAPITDDDVVISMSRRVVLLELKNEHCRWPMGDPQSPDFTFCAGRRVDPFSDSNSYCAYHSRVAYVSSQKGLKSVSDETRAKMRAAHVKRGSSAWGNG